MPTLPPIDFRLISAAEEVLAWRSTVSVDQTGIFHVSFPDFLVEVASTALPDFNQSGRDVLTITQHRTQWQVQGSNLHTCKTFLHQVGTAYLRTETTTERIIVYHFNPAVAYFRTPNGAIHPNAQALPDDVRMAGSWQGTRQARREPQPYAVELYAQVIDRITERRGDHEAIRYTRPTLPPASWGARLNHWNHQGIPDASRTLWPHVPYTEAAAQFFYVLLYRWCELADQATRWLSRADTLADTLAHPTRLALMDTLWNSKAPSDFDFPGRIPEEAPPS